MAFRQQPRIQPVRQQSFPAVSADDVQSLASSSHQRKRSLQDSQEEWVLFSPIAPTETTSSERTPRTAGLSRFSEIVSLDTNARSDYQDDVISEVQSEFVEDDGELDSLDDGLHAFHEPADVGSPRQRMLRTGETVLPSHDGLGSFGNLLAQDPARQGLTQPPRKQRRRSVVQRTLDALHEAEEHDEEEQLNVRIERWRLEQSRALLEEVERETRRIRRITRMASSQSVASSLYQTKSETNFSETSGVMTPMAMEEPEPVSQPAAAEPVPVTEEPPPESESFWKRLTRRVIRDLIGIDEALLTVILGESLPEDSSTARTSAVSALIDDTHWSSPSWQERLLQRLARELGILVHQLSEHPGAFSAYLKTQEPIPYVGATLAHIPSTPSDFGQPGSSAFLDSPVSHTASSVLFPSTLRQVTTTATKADLSLWGIEEEPEEPYTDPVTAERLRKERAYWEQELDVGMVFNFLRAKFSSSSSSAAYQDPFPTSRAEQEAELSTTPTNTSLGLAAANNNLIPTNDLLRTPTRPRLSMPTSHPFSSALAASPTIAGPSRTHARAALIRAHHPLASRTPIHRNYSDQSVSQIPTSPAQNQGAFSSPRRSLAARRSNASSCASQSTRKSKIASTKSANYWDFAAGEGSISMSMSGSRDGISL
jgi:hypothetical protein